MTEPLHESEGFFVTSAYAPDGTKYSIQVVPVFSGAGPIRIGFRDGAARGPVLGAVNRLLAKIQPPPTHSRDTILTVTRIDFENRDNDEDVLTREVTDVGAGRSAALRIQAEIRSGDFRPES